VRLSPLGTAATTGLLYQPQIIDECDCGAVGGMKIGRVNRSTRRKPAPVPLCSPQIPHDLTRARTPAAAVESQRLTAWSMAQPNNQLTTAVFKISSKRWSYPCNRPWRPIGLWDVEAPTFSTQSAHRWRRGCQPYTPAALFPTGRFLVLISVRGWVDPREGLIQLKNLVAWGTEPVTFRLVV
jgi:hypothetical protein